MEFHTVKETRNDEWVSLALHRYESEHPDPVRVILLHGFTGSAKEWNLLLPFFDEHVEIIAPDLPGHGMSDKLDDPDFYLAANQTSMLHQLFQDYTKDKRKPVLCGYSMGGRLALAYALKYPDTISGLILLSATAGITDQQERDIRRDKDRELAAFAAGAEIDEFMDLWLAQPVMESLQRLPEALQQMIYQNRLNNTPSALAASLLGFGTGVMPPMWDQLQELNLPTLLITGEQDTKFTVINQEMKELMPNAAFYVVTNAGHSVHLENPTEVSLIINKYITTLFKNE